MTYFKIQAQHLLRLKKIMNIRPKYSIQKLPKHKPSESVDVEMMESKSYER
jgi:hypothetical protein